MTKFHPLLAAKADFNSLHFPLMASPKIDGIRAIVMDGVVYSRSGKPIPNLHVQNRFGHLNGFDGELVVGDSCAPDCFRLSQSGIMSREGEPQVTFYVFDWWHLGSFPYSKRYAPHIISFKRGLYEPDVQLLDQHMLYSSCDLREYEAACLSAGFEGVMLRDPDALYKHGRATARSGELLKLKRFEDAEAVITGLERLVRADGTVEETLGAFNVRDVQSGVEFSLGAGLTDEERRKFWRKGDAMIGQLARYRHFPVGVKDKPRFPTFAGLRSRLDVSAAAVREVAYA